ncbi:hypothetical protein D3Z51_16900 [Clostridiaceae bacterium]|nr:hypothetical protein [Clostridiaceae bacterium]RKI09067.1 hypothetical protein D7V81_18090 [bacterium 1XD21-70]
MEGGEGTAGRAKGSQGRQEGEPGTARYGWGAFAGILGVLKFPDFALKQKCILSERSEFMHFCFAFSKRRKF